MQAGRRLVESCGAKLRVITVFEHRVLAAQATLVTSGASINDLVRGELRGALDALLAEQPDELAVEGRFLEGAAGELLAKESAELDLMVTGSRGYGPHARINALREQSQAENALGDACGVPVVGACPTGKRCAGSCSCCTPGSRGCICGRSSGMGWGTPVGVFWTSGSGPVSAPSALRGLRSQEWITKSRYLNQEFQRHQRPQEYQPLRSLSASEFAESSGSLPRTARSSTCAARCPSATASGVVGTSTRNRPVPIGLRRPTTTQSSRRMEGTSLLTTSGWRICAATNVTTDGV